MGYAPTMTVTVANALASLAVRDRERAGRVAAELGAPLLEVATHEGDREDYRRNGPDRCYFCKDELFSVISAQLAREQGLDAVAYGENADDGASTSITARSVEGSVPRTVAS